MQKQVEDAARERLNGLLSKEDREQLRAKPVLRTHIAPSIAIVEYARQERVDLIVMGTHGRGAVAHLLMGSVAERVVRTAPCPVLDRAVAGARVPDAGCARRGGQEPDVRPIAPPPPATDDLDAHRLVLRDGSTASVRMAGASRPGADARGSSTICPPSRTTDGSSRRGEPSDALIKRFCDSSDLARGLTLVACSSGRQ